MSNQPNGPKEQLRKLANVLLRRPELVDPHTGWKVVTQQGFVGARGGLWYRSACCIGPGDSLHYPLDEWVMPKKDCGPLCVFDDRDQAISFARSLDMSDTNRMQSARRVVFKCLYYPSSQDRIWDNYRETVQLLMLPRRTSLAMAVCLDPDGPESMSEDLAV